MKIITKSVINMATGEVEYEESYDYDGPIAKCGGGDSSPSVSYVQSPEQKKIFRAISPVVDVLSKYALGNVGYSAPSSITQPTTALPTLPKAGYYSGYHPTRGDYEAGYSRYNPPQDWLDIYGTPATTTPTSTNMGNVNQLYDIPSMPSINQLIPQKGWFNNLDPSVMSGLWEPWNEASRKMLEQMGSTGQIGSASGGFSGAAGVALGDLFSKAGKNVGLQAWNMVSPAYQTGYNAELQRRAEQLQEYQMPYNILPGLLGATYPTNVVQPAGPSGASAISGGLGGALAGYKAIGNPWGAAVGAGAGLLGGK